MISFSGIVLLNVITLFSMSLLPSGAFLGINVVLWDVVGALGSILPTAYCVRVLLDAHPSSCTIFEVVAHAAGAPIGAFFVLCEWVGSITWTIPLLEFVAIGFAKGIGFMDFRNEETDNIDGTYLAIAVVIQMALLTYLQWGGIEKAMSALAALTLIGNIPLLVLASSLFSNSHLLSMPPKGRLFNPNASAVIFGFAGIEVSAFHLREINAETYVAAVYVSVLTVVMLYAIGQLLVASLVPEARLDLACGTYQALKIATGDYSEAFAISCVLTAVGGFATILPWLLGPVRGIAELLKYPEHSLILAQNLLCVCLGWVFLCTSASAGFWLLTALSSVATQGLYLAIYWACWRCKTRDLGDALVFIGAFTSLVGIVLVLWPPGDIALHEIVYLPIVITFLILLAAASRILGKRWIASAFTKDACQPLKL